MPFSKRDQEDEMATQLRQLVETLEDATVTVTLVRQLPALPWKSTVMVGWLFDPAVIQLGYRQVPAFLYRYLQSLVSLLQTPIWQQQQQQPPPLLLIPSGIMIWKLVLFSRVVWKVMSMRYSSANFCISQQLPPAQIPLLQTQLRGMLLVQGQGSLFLYVPSPRNPYDEQIVITLISFSCRVKFMSAGTLDSKRTKAGQLRVRLVFTLPCSERVTPARVPVRGSTLNASPWMQVLGLAAELLNSRMYTLQGYFGDEGRGNRILQMYSQMYVGLPAGDCGNALGVPTEQEAEGLNSMQTELAVLTTLQTAVPTVPPKVQSELGSKLGSKVTSGLKYISTQEPVLVAGLTEKTILRCSVPVIVVSTRPGSEDGLDIMQQQKLSASTDTKSARPQNIQEVAVPAAITASVSMQIAMQKLVIEPLQALNIIETSDPSIMGPMPLMMKQFPPKQSQIVVQFNDWKSTQAVPSLIVVSKANTLMEQPSGTSFGMQNLALKQLSALRQKTQGPTIGMSQGRPTVTVKA